MNLGRPTIVSGVKTQGHPDGGENVTGYKVAYRKNSSTDLVYVTDGHGKAKVEIYYHSYSRRLNVICGVLAPEYTSSTRKYSVCTRFKLLEN